MYLYLKQQKNAFLVACCAMSLVLFFPSFAHAFLATIGNALMNATAMLTGSAGLLLNYAIEYLVLGMGNLLGYGDENTIGMGFVITEMWTVIRDVCNIAFIFGLIFIGFQTILNVETLNTKKTLVAVIVGALLINFSLFFTQVIIDVSNVLAAELHERLLVTSNTLESNSPVETSTTITSDGRVTADDLNYGVAGIFINNMGLLKFFGTGDNLTSFNIQDDISSGFTYFFMGTIFLLIAAFVFAAGAILLVIRFVTLTLLMIFSPILFAGMVFPQTEGFAKGLWKKLLQNAFLAPVYFFMLVLTAKFLDGTSRLFTGDFSKLGGIETENSGAFLITNFAVVLNFVLAAVLLIAALVIAKQLSAAGADKSISMLKGAGKRAGRFAGGAAFGTAAAVGRGTLGKAAYRLSESERLKERAATGFFSKQLLKGSRGVASSSFDARRVGGVGKNLGIGEGKKGGHKAYVDDVKKKEAAFAKSLGEVGDDDQKVRERKAAVDAKKHQLQLQKDNGAPAAVRRQTEAELKQLEEELRREKHRRQIGSPAHSELQQQIKDARKNRTQLVQQLGEATDTNTIETVKQQIVAQDDVIKGLVKDARKNAGYAGRLENSSHIRSWLTGRFNKADQLAGADVREFYEKKVAKSPEDARTDKIVDTLKESASKAA